MTDSFSDIYWSNRYQTGMIGWDIGTISTPLKAYFDQLNNKILKILIAGCGNAYEAEYLLENGFTDITLVDISTVLVNELSKKLNHFIEKGHCKVIHQDFFEHLGQYDLIVEQTFFCAIDPDLRINYAQKTYELLKPNGKIAGLLFDREFIGGPPFGGSKAAYLTYFESIFKVKTMEPCYNSIKPRAGSELFIILEKFQIQEIQEIQIQGI
jgi:methyl halide transferase